MSLWISAMRRRFYAARRRYDQYRQRLWFYPLPFILLAVLLFVATSLLDQRLTLFEDAFQEGVARFLVFGGSGDAARSVLSTIAGAWATLLGVVYSITIVVLQLAANKFTSQIIPRFERDRLTQVTLGSFAGVVVYALLLLKTVRAPDVGGDGFVPHTGTNVAIFWAVLSLILTVLFIAHLSKQIQPIPLVNDIAQDGIDALAALSGSTEPDWIQPAKPEVVRQKRDGYEVPAIADEGGYVQVIEWKLLFEATRTALSRMAEDGYIHVELERTINDAIERGDRLGRVVLGKEAQAIGEDLAAWIHQTLQVSQQRTARRDPRYAVEELSNMGIQTVESGDVDVAAQCLKGLIALYRAVVTEHTPEAVLEIVRDHRRAYVSLKDPQMRQHTLDGIERLYMQAVRKQYGLIVETFFEETRTLIDHLVRRHHDVWCQQGMKDSQPCEDATEERSDEFEDQGKSPEEVARRYAESLEILLQRLKRLYFHTGQKYEDTEGLAAVTEQWIEVTKEAIELDDPLARQLVDFLVACYSSLSDRGEIVRVFAEAFHSLEERARERKAREVLTALRFHGATIRAQVAQDRSRE